jgi:hypothetical protein
MDEIRNGYLYEMMLVGHLNEAEEESHQWQILHNMIRDARKRYQQEGVVPDWNLLANTLRDVKDGRIAPVDTRRVAPYNPPRYGPMPRPEETTNRSCTCCGTTLAGCHRDSDCVCQHEGEDQNAC